MSISSPNFPITGERDTSKMSENILSVNLGQFNGAFSRFQTSAYGDLVRGGVEKPVAHKVAFDYGSDLGTAMKMPGTFATAIGKAKENKATLKIGASVKGTNNTRTMSVIRASQQMSGLFEENLFLSRSMPKLAKELQDYLDECAEWIVGKQFVEDGKVIFDYTEKVEVTA
jgi:hypothetical protein